MIEDATDFTHGVGCRGFSTLILFRRCVMSWKMLAAAAMFVSFGTVSAFAAGEVQMPEVQKPEIHKPEMQKPEIQRPEIQRPEVHKAERVEHAQRPERHR